MNMRILRATGIASAVGFATVWALSTSFAQPAKKTPQPVDPDHAAKMTKGLDVFKKHLEAARHLYLAAGEAGNGKAIPESDRPGSPADDAGFILDEQLDSAAAPILYLLTSLVIAGAAYLLYALLHG